MLLEEYIKESIKEIIEEKRKRKSSSKKKKPRNKNYNKKPDALKTSLMRKAEEHNAPYYILKKIHEKGLAAWSTGHTPGIPPAQWAMARVNAVLRGGKAREVDSAEWKKIVDYRKKQKNKKKKN